jgi:hypothetical protein
MCRLRFGDFLLGLHLDQEEGGDMFLRNVGGLQSEYIALYLGIVHSSQPTLWELHIQQNPYMFWLYTHFNDISSYYYKSYISPTL